MKPKILNDITNIFAKWAGSKDYDPRVKYDTPLEYYANEVPVLPKPRAGDAGKSPVAKSDGTYELKSIDIGDNVFIFKGSVATVADLPVENNSIGDVWFVESELGNFVWLVDEANPDGFWDEFGQPIDLSNYQMKPTIVTDLETASVTIASAADNTEYVYGELTALAITSFTAISEFSIVFVSGATPTTLTVPQTLIMPDGFTVEANTRYEINVKNGYAVVCGWAVGS